MGTPVVFRRDDNGEPIIPNRYLSLFNNTPLGANATYSQPWIDSTLTFFMDKSGYAGPQDVNFVSGSALADQSGTLYLDQTDDSNTVAGNANNYFSTSVAVSASTLTEFPLTNLKHKWYRFRYVNGATAQTSFELGQMSERIDAFDQIALTGSNVIKGATVTMNTVNVAANFPSFSCREITVIAFDANVGNIYVGGSDVSTSNYGVKLKKDGSFTFKVSNADMIYILADTAGDGASYVAV